MGETLSTQVLGKPAGPTGKPNLYRRVFSLAWPTILDMALLTVVWVFDTAMVGRLGAQALSAVGLGGQIYWIVRFVFGAVGTGATIFVSRVVGAGDGEEAGRTGGQALALAFLGALSLGILIFALAPALFGLAQLGPEVNALGISYLRIISALVVKVLKWPLTAVWWVIVVEWAVRTALTWRALHRGRWLETQV
ncbi:MAG: MATE family efflux transporter [Bacillota bacterium]